MAYCIGVWWHKISESWGVEAINTDIYANAQAYYRFLADDLTFDWCLNPLSNFYIVQRDYFAAIGVMGGLRFVLIAMIRGKRVESFVLQVRDTQNII